MYLLKNITPQVVSLQMFKTSSPQVNFIATNVILSLKPGEVVEESIWKVDNINDPSYNSNIIDDYISRGILTRIIEYPPVVTTVIITAPV